MQHGPRFATRRLRATATLVGVAALILPQVTPVAAHAAATTVSAVRLNGFEAALLADMNSTRRAHGLGALTVVPGATDVARRWSWRLAGTQVLSHNPSLITALEHAGSASWTMIAENVGTGSSTSPSTLFTAYMNSAPHRANILDPAARFVGVGVVERAGRAWNTVDFVNSYSSGYGVTRVPAAGLAMDRIGITTTRTLATFEGSRDERAGSAASGAVTTSHLLFSGPTAGDDRAYASFTRHGSTGHGDLLVREAWDLTHARTVSFRARATDPLQRAVSVQVVLTRAYGATVSLGQVALSGTARTVTLTLPSAAHTLMDTLTLRVQSASLATAGGSATVSVYGVTVGA